jgi:hypothetical protein
MQSSSEGIESQDHWQSGAFDDDEGPDSLQAARLAKQMGSDGA